MTALRRRLAMWTAMVRRNGWYPIGAGTYTASTRRATSAGCTPPKRGRPATVTLGDVDGDGQVETLVASDDRGLYCLGLAR